MAERIGWTRDQQLIALRLYMRTPFGKLHGRNPDIISLASRIGRTASALAMKACNFASLDPEFRLTNRTGLSGASEADRAIWAEFEGNAERVAAEAEEAFARFDPTGRPRTRRTSASPPARPRSRGWCVRGGCSRSSGPR
jgi:hypothetical protein